jgi:hypothetical protein
VQETVAEPDPVTPAGEIGPQVRPEGIMSVKLTVPRKLLIDVTVIADETEAPTLTGAGEVAAMVKSWTLKTAVVE